MIYLKVGKRENDAPDRNCFFVRIPFSIYFGWLSVAVVANVAAFLVSAGWNGFGISPVIWTIVILIIAASIAIANTLIRQDMLYPLVFVWAYVGIAVANAGTQMIVLASYILAGLIFLGAVFAFVRGLQKGGKA
ncbi:MAG: hypothetical protein R2883_07815 [Caldisericia bacterium]